MGLTQKALKNKKIKKGFSNFIAKFYKKNVPFSLKGASTYYVIIEGGGGVRALMTVDDEKEGGLKP